MLFSRRKKIMADVQFVTVDLNLAFNQCKGSRIRRHRQFYFWFIHLGGSEMSASFINRYMAGDKAQLRFNSRTSEAE